MQEQRPLLLGQAREGPCQVNLVLARDSPKQVFVVPLPLGQISPDLTGNSTIKKAPPSLRNKEVRIADNRLTKPITRGASTSMGVE